MPKTTTHEGNCCTLFDLITEITIKSTSQCYLSVMLLIVGLIECTLKQFHLELKMFLSQYYKWFNNNHLRLVISRSFSHFVFPALNLIFLPPLSPSFQDSCMVINSSLSYSEEWEFHFCTGRFLGFPSVLANSRDSSPSLESSALTWPLSNEMTGLIFGCDPIHSWSWSK